MNIMNTKSVDLRFKKDRFNFITKLIFKLFKIWMSDETFSNWILKRWFVKIENLDCVQKEWIKL